MALTRQQVLHVAGLARLELTESEAAQLETDLGHILEHVDQLSQVSTEGVQATEHVSVRRLAFRRDEVVVGVSQTDALRPSARTLAGSFAVPAFVDD